MIRIGHAWDTHKLVEGRELILGGVSISSNVGLLGHSDADVCYHAIAESLLGSLALGDLGVHFSDTDIKFKGMDSSIIMNHAKKLVSDKGYKISNLDITIFSQFIRINPYKEEMIKNISTILQIDRTQVSVKATTYEKMGFIGRGEALACECVCLVYND